MKFIEIASIIAAALAFASIESGCATVTQAKAVHSHIANVGVIEDFAGALVEAADQELRCPNWVWAKNDESCNKQVNKRPRIE
jgi:hypothetical protein